MDAGGGTPFGLVVLPYVLHISVGDGSHIYSLLFNSLILFVALCQIGQIIMEGWSKITGVSNQRALLKSTILEVTRLYVKQVSKNKRK